MAKAKPTNNRKIEGRKAKLRKNVEPILDEIEAVRGRLQDLQEAKVEAKPKPEYSAKVIQRYREMEESHAFVREIKKRVPVDLDNDEMTLSCGHRLKTIAFLINAAAGRFRCEECKDLWLAKAVADEKKDMRRKQGGSGK